MVRSQALLEGRYSGRNFPNRSIALTNASCELSCLIMVGRRGAQSVRNYGVAQMPNGAMTIGQVAAKADVHVETIRYYQRIGLVGEPDRPPGGIRHYDDKAVARLRFIKRSQQLGFSLDEVRNLLALEDGQNCRDTRLLAEKKLEVIGSRLADLRRMQKQLRQLIRECESGRRPRACPIIAALSA
jgi:MerR family mercuric resistance operon transcriptional regulator